MAPIPQTAEQLEQAFATFNQMSGQLEESYRDLEQQVASLTEQLSKAHSTRLIDIAEKERLANRLARLHELLPAAVIVVNDKDQITDCNPVALDMLGNPLLGQKWEKIRSQAINDTNENQQHLSLQDGRIVQMLKQAMDDEPGNLLLLVDISREMALQEITHRNDRLVAMGEMAASLAHQIRTPLATAILYASQMKSTDMSVQDRERFTDRLNDRLRHIEIMINDMLRFSRIGRYDAETTSVAVFFENLAIALEADIERYQTTIRFECEEPEAVIVGHADALQSALMNLITNAMQAHSGRAEISLSFKTDNQGQYSLTVKDNGPGISEANLGKIFNPFFTTRSDGTGLGLAVVESIVNAHGGTVKCDSAPGRGCVFTLSMPHINETGISADEEMDIQACNQVINGRNP